MSSNIIYPYHSDTKVNGKTLGQRVYDRAKSSKKQHIEAHNDFNKSSVSSILEVHLNNLILEFGEAAVKRAVKLKLGLVNSKQKAA